MKHKLELNLQAYLDGELSPREAKRVSDWLASDRDAVQLFAELQNTKTALTHNDLELKVPETREFYWGKIERQIQSEAQSRPATVRLPLLRWQKFFAPLVGAAAMFVLLIVSVKQFSPASASDDVTTTSDEMEALTFRDHSAGMTVVWLQERDQETPQADISSDVESR